MENISKILWGLVFVAIGIIVGLNTLGIIDYDIFFTGWWTLFIIIPCFIGLFDRSNVSKSGNIIGIVIGVLLLLAARGIFSFAVIAKLFVPFIFVFIGLSIIFSNSIKNKVTEKIKEANTGDLEDIVATFSEQVVNRNNEEFKGAKLDAVFGSIVLDLSKAKLEKETIIKASAIFGGIDLIVPKDVTVKVKATPIFGGVTNDANKNSDGKKVIYLDGFALFGGIEIK